MKIQPDENNLKKNIIFTNTIKGEIYDFTSFVVDESKNLLAGLVNNIGSQLINKFYYKYLDYFELNLPIDNFSPINYIAIITPVIIYILIYVAIIVFIIKGMHLLYSKKIKKNT
tara:strand:- start:3731 stop:4072 length:342 start_codon:yes stop_codon:yes gene_type:complete